MTTYLSVQHLTHQFGNGEVLFSDLSFTLNDGVTAPIGSNGVGKSTLLERIMQHTHPSDSKHIRWNVHHVAYYHQAIAQQDRSALGSIADYLEISQILDALKRLKEGQGSEDDILIIGDAWDLEQKLTQELRDIGMTYDLQQACATLSGGEFSRLALYQLIRKKPEYLILDEPSNHLDQQARTWLMSIIRQQKGVLLVSHDQELLNLADQTYELSPQGLKFYGGNYEHYKISKERHNHAIKQEINNCEQNIKRLLSNQQKNIEKASSRAQQGQQLLRSGSQSNIVMHAKKNAAQQSLSAQKSKAHRLISTTQERLKELKQNQEQQRKLSLTLASSAKQNNRVLDIVDLILPFGYDKPLHISLDYGDRIHLTGSNGSGKSTLLKCIAGLITPRQGQIYKHSQPIYLDQHFGMLKNASDSIQTYIQKKCEHLTEVGIRTLLAGIGFRRDRVYQQLSTLSGGELMKIAMLSVSHQQEKNILLLLDEPDNHLDLEAKRYLAQIIQEYQGPFLLVSHDKNFTHSISFNKSLDLSPIT